MRARFCAFPELNTSVQVQRPWCIQAEDSLQPVSCESLQSQGLCHGILWCDQMLQVSTLNQSASTQYSHIVIQMEGLF
jgi:hypothetical protein